MTRSHTRQLTITLALFTAIAPLLLAVYIARQEATNDAVERVMGFVDDVLYRSDSTVIQMQEALIQMNGLPSTCSDSLVSQMQQLALELDLVEVIGHMDGTTMDCSSLGWHDPMELGEVDIVSVAGGMVRLDVDLPNNAGPKFIGLERNSFVIISNREQAMDPIIERADVRIATFSPSNQTLRSSSQGIDPAWIARLGDKTQLTFIDGDDIVGIARSSRVQLTGAIAAISIDVLNQSTLEFITALLPIALIAGAGLSVLVFQLFKHRTSLPNEIKRALNKDEFFLTYQPIVSLQTHQCVGAEALVRWRKSSGIIAMPDTFVAAAEECGLIGRLTERVITLAKRDLSILAGSQVNFSLALNLSASDLVSDHILQLLRDTTKDAMGRISVELTERVMLDPISSSASMKNLRSAGIKVSLDDFGTGYSSLSYLETMAFDCLKIDRLFVEAIDTGAATNRVVLHIIEMAKTLNLTMVAEGVETRAQADFLRDHGVEYAQGWLFGRPVELEQFVAKMETTAQRPVAA